MQPDFGLRRQVRRDAAFKIGRRPFIAALLNAGADIQSRGEHGYSPLHEAVEQGHIEAVRLLLERGASVTATCDDGHTPIQSAQILSEHEIETLLQTRAA